MILALGIGLVALGIATLANAMQKTYTLGLIMSSAFIGIGAYMVEYGGGI